MYMPDERSSIDFKCISISCMYLPNSSMNDTVIFLSEELDTAQVNDN